MCSFEESMRKLKVRDGQPRVNRIVESNESKEWKGGRGRNEKA